MLICLTDGFQWGTTGPVRLFTAGWRYGRLLMKALDKDLVSVEDKWRVKKSLDGKLSFGTSQDSCGLVMEEEVMTRQERDEGPHLI